jgi:SAM-dependent methyltransferase
METIKACRICGGSSIRTFFDLGSQPLANSLLKSPDEEEKFYPLSLSWCEDCCLVQLNETVDPKELFSTYVWVTGTSKTANEFADKFYKEFVGRAGGSKEKYVLEIASNDGTFLKPFLRDGWKVLGVDPAKNIADTANKEGIPTECVFFGKEAAEELLEKRGPARLVFARNVLPHVANTHDFVDGLRVVLSDDGVLAVETHYAKTILEGLHYDSIYHEHLCYFTLKSLERLLRDHGLYVFDVTASPISGGSIIVYARKHEGREKPEIHKYRERESNQKTNNFASWKGFAAKSFAHREKLLEVLDKARSGGKRVIGWGASARSSTMLNFCGIDCNVLNEIVDLNPLKQGLFTAGTHIPIKGAEEVMEKTPNCVFILAWNFADEIIEALKNRFDYKGQCIIPLPVAPRVLQLG